MKHKPFYRTPLFWLALVVLALCSIVFLCKNFEKANPLVNVSVKSSRDEVLAKATQLAVNYHLGPEPFRQAASFQNDTRFQNYTELEGGGLKVFNEVIEKGIYSSFHWKVRLFKENEVNEVLFLFSPDGKPCGFSETLSEKLTNRNLPVDSALLCANRALDDWQFDSSNYELAEKKAVEKQGGRVDHEFVYERTDYKVNECSFRIAITVSGNKVTQIEPFAHIPDNFDRRYAEMRSENDLINTIGFALLYLVYGLIGAGFGLFFLMKRRLLHLRKAILWSLAIGLGTGILEVLNIFPLLWFNYDTSTTIASFIGKNLFSGLLNTLLMGGIIFLSAMVGEGLTRYLFPGKLQFWKLWSRESGGSIQVLGQTVGAYLFVPIFLAIDILYYLITTKYFGWWNPAGTLYDPDILANNLPWFGPIANSLQAGFWEELICRAVPLAGVYLLVRNVKAKNLWMILTLFVQTVIFGMLHANYPQSPAYVRVIEMIIPFFIFGLIYLRFGLLPLMITHYSVDVFWMSLPIWVASSPGIWMSRVLIAVLFFIPLLVVVYWIIRNRKLNDAPASAYNNAWTADENEKIDLDNVDEAEDKNYRATKPIFRLNFNWLIPAAIAGLVVWTMVFVSVHYDNGEVKINREEAIDISKKLLYEKYAFLPEKWKILTSIKSVPSEAHKFIWQIRRNEFEKLQQTVLPEPYWMVRFVTPSASVEERAEEFMVKVGIDGRILGYQHVWPEKREGRTITEAEALEKAKKNFEDYFGISASAAKVITVKPSKTDWRTNWLIELTDSTIYALPEGLGLFKTTISADEVSETGAYVKPSEQWQRENDRHKSSMRILNLLSNFAIYIVLILGVIFGVINWSRKRFSMRLFVLFGIAFATLSIIGIFNSWNLILSSYYTGLPFGNYLIMTIISSFIGVIFLSMGIAVIGGYSEQLTLYDADEGKALIKSLCVGVILTGLYSVKRLVITKTGPLWMDLSNLNDLSPSYGFLNDNLLRCVTIPAFAMFLYYFANRLSHQFVGNKTSALLLIFITGFLIAGTNAVSFLEWLELGSINGIIFIVIYLLLYRNIAWAPIVFLVPLIFSLLEQVFKGYVYHLIPGILITIAFACFFSIFWFIRVRKNLQ